MRNGLLASWRFRQEGQVVFSFGRRFKVNACEGQKASQWPHLMHMPAISSATSGRVLLSPGFMIPIEQMVEQTPQLLQRSLSTIIVVISVIT